MSRGLRRPCAVEDCIKPVYARGYCTMHYTRVKKTGRLELDAKLPPEIICSVNGCALKAEAKKMCRKHYRAARLANGEVQPCREESCGEPACARGWCSKHYSQNMTPAQKFTCRLRDLYSMTVERYEELLAEQGGVCAIEGCTETTGDHSGRPLQVDHDHACCPRKSCGDCVRGLLCRGHNYVVGYLEHPDREAVERYIELHRTKRNPTPMEGITL